MSAFALLGAATIVSQSETIALVLGIAWLGSCLGRLLSIVFDRSWSVHVADPENARHVLDHMDAC